MEQTGKLLVVAGLTLAVIGGLMWLGLFRWLRLGRLPGDIVIEKPGFALYFPLTTMVVIGLVLMAVAWAVSAFRR